METGLTCGQGRQILLPKHLIYNNYSLDLKAKPDINLIPWYNKTLTEVINTSTVNVL